MRSELRAIQRRVGLTFIYITHDQGEALTMSDHVAVMREGVIEQIADGRTIYDDPASAFVASFVGENNAFSGQVTAVADGDGGGRHRRSALARPDRDRGARTAQGRRPGDDLHPARGAGRRAGRRRRSGTTGSPAGSPPRSSRAKLSPPPRGPGGRADQDLARQPGYRAGRARACRGSSLRPDEGRGPAPGGRARRAARKPCASR